MSKGRYTCSVCRSDFHDVCTNLVCIVGFHVAKSTGSEKPEEMDDRDDPLDTLMSTWRHLGLDQGQDGVLREMLTKAGEFFTLGRDEVANEFRAFATSRQTDLQGHRERMKQAEKAVERLQQRASRKAPK